ncbi:5-hydroxytryptamine receptor 5B-like isoform X2 [Macrobrachium nipponense]
MVAVGVEGLASWAASLVLTFVLALVFLISSVLNTVFLVIFFRRPALRSISNRFIVSLTVCNLLASWLLLPLVVTDSFLTGWKSEAFCRGLDAVSELVASASVFATVLIAFDRFCAITDPLHYHMRITRLMSVAMIALGWGIPALIATAAAMEDLSGRTWNVCKGFSASGEAWTWTYRSYFVVFNMVLSFVIPTHALIWFYVKIYHAAHKNSERTRRNSLCGATLDAVAPSRAPSRTPSTRSTSSQIVTNLRHRISNASLFLHKEESRAAKISVVVIVLFFVCWLPYYAVALFHTPLIEVWMPDVSQSIVMVLALSNSAISPYLYLYRSRRIQREVRRLLGLPLSGTKTAGGSSRRRPQPRLQLEMIPPSPTVPNGNFESPLDPYHLMVRDQRAVRPSPLTVIFNKLFRAKGLAWEPWRDSITSTSSSSATSTSNSTTTSAGTECSATESECMLPRMVVSKPLS